MKFSKRISDITESVTLKLNARAVELKKQGKRIFNLTAGQLPFRPSSGLVEKINSNTNFLMSFQYTPVAGIPDLRSKFIKHVEETRNIDFGASEIKNIDFDCIISNGAKHSIFLSLWSLVGAGDEVVILSPFWVSYPEMIKLCGAKPVKVDSNIFDNFEPDLDKIRKAITSNTKAIIINSPTNPTGTHYRVEWMNDFGKLMLEFPDITIISDEIYYQLVYFDPRPTYFYQKYPELLSRTIIVDGISKILASTGIRIGFSIAPKEIVKSMSKLQGHTTSGANSLIQKALIDYDLSDIEVFLSPIKDHLRLNAKILRNSFREENMPQVWYQTVSAFYFLIDFSECPVMKKYSKGVDDKNDYATVICEDILNNLGVAIVPSTDFGIANSARISLVLEPKDFEEAVKIILKFLIDE
jgi:aspartate aminotransferase